MPAPGLDQIPQNGLRTERMTAEPFTAFHSEAARIAFHAVSAQLQTDIRHLLGQPDNIQQLFASFGLHTGIVTRFRGAFGRLHHCDAHPPANDRFVLAHRGYCPNGKKLQIGDHVTFERTLNERGVPKAINVQLYPERMRALLPPIDPELAAALAKWF